MPALLQGGIFFALLLTASIFDIKKRIIPDSICVLTAMSGLIAFEPVKLLGLLVALPFLIAAISCGGIGGGDIKIIGASGIVLGFGGAVTATIVGLTVSLLFFAVYHFINQVRRRVSHKALPLAPFLSIGCMAAFILKLIRK